MIDSYIGDSIESCVCVAAINKRNENKRKKNAKKTKSTQRGKLKLKLNHEVATHFKCNENRNGALMRR